MTVDSAVDLGTGITIALSGDSTSSTFCAQIIDVTPPALTRGSVDTAHMGTTGARPKIAHDLYSVGPLRATIHFNPATTPPITSAAGTVTLTYGSTTTWAWSGFLSSYEPHSPLEDKMTADIEVEVCGAITITAAT